MSAVNQFIVANAESYMRTHVPPDFADLTITSPPYE